MENSFNISDLVRDNVKKLKPYSSARDEYISNGDKMIFLDANENPFENGINRYPDPHQRKLKSVLAAKKGISEDQILLGNGSDEILDLIFRAFCEPKIDHIITLPPTYGMYKVLAETNDVSVVEIPLTKEFEPDIEIIMTKINQFTKLLFLCSPNNPTGNTFSKEKITQLLTIFKGIVVIDEAYIDFSDQVSWAQKLNAYPNLIVTQTLSKAYGMAGIRLGICFASEEIIEILKKIKPPYNVNELTQLKAVERLQKPEAIEIEVSRIKSGKRFMVDALQKISFVTKVFNSDANFILAKVDDANKRYQQLIEKGIVVRNRSNQILCENCLRFTIGTELENAKLINVLNELQ